VIVLDFILAENPKKSNWGFNRRNPFTYRTLICYDKSWLFAGINIFEENLNEK